MTSPAVTGRWTCWITVGLTLVQRRSQWTNIKPTLIQRFVSARRALVSHAVVPTTTPTPPHQTRTSGPDGSSVPAGPCNLVVPGSKCSNSRPTGSDWVLDHPLNFKTVLGKPNCRTSGPYRSTESHYQPITPPYFTFVTGSHNVERTEDITKIIFLPKKVRNLNAVLSVPCRTQFIFLVITNV